MSSGQTFNRELIDAEVAAGHAAYIAALRKLFNDNKDRFGFGDRELVVS